jgi:two-component system CheB/CheR fusion protein
VIIDEAMQVLQFRGATSRYLEHAPGAASLNLLQMARLALVVDLRSGAKMSRFNRTASR